MVPIATISQQTRVLYSTNGPRLSLVKSKYFANTAGFNMP